MTSLERHACEIPPTFNGHYSLGFILFNLAPLTMELRDALYKIHKYIEFIIYTYISCSRTSISTGCQVF